MAAIATNPLGLGGRANSNSHAAAINGGDENSKMSRIGKPSSGLQPSVGPSTNSAVAADTPARSRNQPIDRQIGRISSTRG